MKIVREHIEFERSRDPYDNLSIGIWSKVKENFPKYIPLDYEREKIKKDSDPDFLLKRGLSLNFPLLVKYAINRGSNIFWYKMDSNPNLFNFDHILKIKDVKDNDLILKKLELNIKLKDNKRLEYDKSIIETEKIMDIESFFHKYSILSNMKKNKEKLMQRINFELGFLKRSGLDYADEEKYSTYLISKMELVEKILEEY